MLIDQAIFGIIMFLVQMAFLSIFAIILDKGWRRFENSIGELFKLQLKSGPFYRARGAAKDARPGHRFNTQGDQLFLWAWCERERGMRQFRVTRMSVLVSEAGDVIENVDIAIWLTKRSAD